EWGWRIPFLLSAVMLAVGLFVRARVSESPLFREAMAKQVEVDAAAEDRPTPPILSILRRPRNLLLVALGCMASFGIQTMFTTFAIGYASHSGVTRSQALMAFAVCQFVAIFTLLGFARLSDRVGRRPVMLFGLGAFVVLIVPILALLSSGNVALVTLGFVLGFGVCQSATYGPMAAYIAEQFGTAARYTGASLGYQGATLLGAGFTPVILASLQAAAGGGTGLVAAFMIGLAVLSAVFILLAKESKDRDLSTYEH
ncbi:MAG: MFS transporter, partial [Rhodococcus sp. (in: high G+C Gram-positive bacteria)]|nr:MFS transporter [Rhodococcus sp. (in: high G+C Gram-positive bacteria)]